MFPLPVDIIFKCRVIHILGHLLIGLRNKIRHDLRLADTLTPGQAAQGQRRAGRQEQVEPARPLAGVVRIERDAPCASAGTGPIGRLAFRGSLVEARTAGVDV